MRLNLDGTPHPLVERYEAPLMIGHRPIAPLVLATVTTPQPQHHTYNKDYY